MHRRLELWGAIGKLLLHVCWRLERQQIRIHAIHGRLAGNCSCISGIRAIHGRLAGNCSCISGIRVIHGRLAGNCSCISGIRAIHGRVAGNCSCISGIRAIHGRQKKGALLRPSGVAVI
jgi:hypothetical protein